MSWSRRAAKKMTYEHAHDGSSHLLWSGARSGQGYPYARNDDGKVELVVRTLWRTTKGFEPKRLYNKCGHRNCIMLSHWSENNPYH